MRKFLFLFLVALIVAGTTTAQSIKTNNNPFNERGKLLVFEGTETNDGQVIQTGRYIDPEDLLPKNINNTRQLRAVLIDPTGDGGFENGSTPAANNWTAVNSTIDAWSVGNGTAPSAGANCGYISSTNGATWAYSQLSVIQHIYYDVTLPAGEPKVTLTFKWKAGGEGTGTSDWDNMKVFWGLVSAMGTPVANTAVLATYQVSGPGANNGMYKLISTAWNSETITMLGTPGQTYRLVFSWKSDVSDIANPPAAIDEVSLTSGVSGNVSSTAFGGLWNSPATWVGGVVPSGDNVTIASGATVVVNQTVSIANLEIDGTLQWITTTSPSATVNTVQADNITIGTTGKLLAHGLIANGATVRVTGNFINNGVANFGAGATTGASLQFNGVSGAMQTLGGTGTFIADTEGRGMIRQLFFVGVSDYTISTSQTLVTGNLALTNGNLNTNGKLHIDMTAVSFGGLINRSVYSVVVNNMGSGYTSAPTVTFTAAPAGGTTATGVANIDPVTGTVRSITITNPGDGYRVAPTVTFSGGGGTGAAAVATMYQSLSALAVSQSQKSPNANITGGLTIKNDQGVGSIFVTNAGTGYTSAPTVGFALPVGFHNLVTNGGSGYTSAPTVTFSGGGATTQATGTAVVARGQVVSVQITAGGTGYTSTPTITITGGGGTGATAAVPAGMLPTATAIIDPALGMITGFNITNPGFGYLLTVPGVTLTGGGATTAATGATSRHSVYSLILAWFSPSPTNGVHNESVVIPTNRRIHALTLAGATGFGLNLTNNLTLYALAPLSSSTISAVNGFTGEINMGGNTLAFEHPNYTGFAGTATAFVSNGSINYRLLGSTGSQTRPFPFNSFSGTENNLITMGAASPVSTTGSTITSITGSIGSAPTGAGMIGDRTLRIQTNGEWGNNPTVRLSWNSVDNLTAPSEALTIAQSTSTSGSWTIRSIPSGSGPINPAGGSRTTATAAPGPIVPTGNDYFGFAMAVANPSGVSAVAAGQNKIDINFTQNTDNNPVIIVFNSTGTFTEPTGTPPAAGQSFAGGTLIYNGASSPFSHTGLLPAETYFYRVFSYNAPAYSAGVSVNATTDCPVFSTFPVTQGFEAVAFPPTCWTVVQVSGTGLWEGTATGANPTTSPQQGTRMAQFRSYNFSAGVSAILVSPAINFPNANYRVNFWMNRDNGLLTNADRVIVHYNTSPNLTGATELGTVHRSINLAPVVTSGGWYNYIFNLPSGASGNGYIIFQAISGYGNNIFIDNAVIEQLPPPCVVPGAQPTALNLTATSNSVNGSFTASPSANGYLVVRHTSATLGGTPVNNTIYSPGASIGSGTVVASGTTTEFSSTALESSTQYFFFVFAYNLSPSCTGPVYRTTTPLTANITTAPAAPVLVATPTSANAIAFTATPNANNNTIVVAWNTTGTFGTPSGTLSPGSQITGGGTVHYVGTATGLFPHTGLTSGTQYFYRAWSVVAGPVYSTTHSSVNATTWFSVPYTQTFDPTTTLPTGWDGTFTVMTNHGTNGSNGLTRNMWSSVPTANSISPAFFLPNNSQRVVFDYRIVNYTGYPSTATILSAGDKIELQTSINGTDYTTVYTINNINHITSTSFAKIKIQLPDYSGRVNFRFLATRTTGDYYVDIDNFAVEEQPPFEITPNSFDFGQVYAGTQSTPQVFTFENFRNVPVTISNVGFSGTDADQFIKQDNNTYPLILQPGASAMVNVLFSPLTVGNKIANLQIVDNFGSWTASLTGIGFVDAPTNLRATAVPPSNVQLTWVAPGYQPQIQEGFEGATFPPAGWIKLSPDGGTGWTTLNVNTSPIPGWQGGTATAAPNGGTKMAFCTWSTGGATANDQWLITPQITVANGDQLSFYMRYIFNSFTDRLQVRISTQTQNTPAHFTIVVADLNFTSSSSTAWQLLTYNLTDFVPAGSQVYIAFRELVSDNFNDGSAITLDNIYVGQLIRQAATTLHDEPIAGIRDLNYVPKITLQADNSNDNTSEAISLIETRNGTPTNYTVYRGTSSGVYDTQFTTANTQYLDESTSSGSTYFYKVAANYPQGQAFTNEVVVNTLCTSPTAIPYSQPFEGTYAPPCWSTVSLNSTNQVWQFGTITGYLTSNPNLDGNYAFINSDAFGSGNSQNTDLRSPVFDFSNYTSITLSFNHYYRHISNGSATLSYSTDGGSTWNEIQTWTASTANPAVFNQMIPGVAEQSNVVFRWNFQGTYGWYWAIDDVTIVEGVNAQASATDLSCFGSNDGSINLTVIGGLPPYTFLWLGPDGFTSTNQNLSGLAAGIYNYTVFDANNIQVSNQVTLTQPAEIAAPTTANITAVYDGTQKTITAVPATGMELVWYDAATGGNVVAAPSATNAGIYTAWAVSKNTSSGCESIRVQATLTIQKKQLTVTASSYTICQSNALPTLEFAYSGFITGEGPQNLEAPVMASTNAVAGGAPGVYPITLAGGVSNNYSFVYNNGSITIIASPLVSAGGDGAVCTSEQFPIVAATASNFTTVIWTTSGNGTFSNTGIVNPVYTPGSQDIANGTVVLTITADPGSQCSATSSMTLTLQNDLPVSVVINQTTPQLCVGTPVSFAALPTNGGLSPGYQWKVNGSNAGTNSASFTYIPVNGDIVTVVLTSSIGCALNNPATSNAIVVNVTPDLTAGVSITASATEVCDFTPVTFTAAPVNGGMNPAYQWKVNGVNAGTNAPAYTYAPLHGDVITVVMTSNHPCAVVPVANSNAVTMTVTQPLLVLQAQPVNGGTVAGGGNYAEGASAALTATPTPGWEFVHWKNMGGVVVSTNPQFQYTVNQCYEVLTAVFSSKAKIAGQLKYFNAAESVVPSPNSNSVFYVQLFEGNVAVSERQLVKYNFETGLDSYFEFIGAESAKSYKLRIWEQATNNVLSNTWTWNNWGGATSIDALIISYMVAENALLTSLPWIAPVAVPNYTPLFSKVADLNNSGNLSGADPLVLQYRITNTPGFHPLPGGAHNFQLATTRLSLHTEKAYPNAPATLFAANGAYAAGTVASDLFYEVPITGLTDGLNVFNVYFVATGDLNASYVPGTAGKSSVNLSYESMIAAKSGDEVLIPVRINQSAELGAITIGFKYNKQLIHVTEVLDYQIYYIDHNEGAVRIAWMNENGRTMAQHENVVVLRAKVLNNINHGTRFMELLPITEFADKHATVIPSVGLSTSYIETGVTSIADLNDLSITHTIFPNPFKDVSTIRYTLPEAGKVRIAVYNHIGQEVKTLMEEIQQAGAQQLMISTNELRDAGTYFYRITLESDNRTYQARGSVVLVK